MSVELYALEASSSRIPLLCVRIVFCVFGWEVIEVSVALSIIVSSLLDYSRYWFASVADFTEREGCNSF